MYSVSLQINLWHLDELRNWRLVPEGAILKGEDCKPSEALVSAGRVRVRSEQAAGCRRCSSAKWELQMLL